MKYSTKFYPEKRKGVEKNVPVMLSVTYERQRMFYYTGIRCDINVWKNLKEKKKNQSAINGQPVREFLADLDRIKVAVDDIFKFYDATNVKPTPNQIRNALKLKLGKTVKNPEKELFFDRFEQFMKRPGISQSTAQHIKSNIKKVKEFNSQTDFATLDVKYINDYYSYLIGDPRICKNSASTELHILSTFLNYSVKNGWIMNNPFKNFSIVQEFYGNPVYITLEERDNLYDAVINDEILAKTRDIFVFQCLIGCRIGDLLELKKSNIINGNIEYIAAKTKEHKPRIARIPLTTKALNIIAKYNLPDGHLIPHLNRKKYNANLKTLFKELDIKRLVTIPDKRTRLNIQVPICDIVTSHMARRVFIGGLYKKGARNEIIASMSGHVKNSKAFSRYYDIDLEDQKSAINLIE